MPNTTLAGHPLHPQLIVMPAGLLPFSLVLDIVHLATKNPSYAKASYYSMLGGLVGGIVAGAAGAGDYLSIPPNTREKNIATFHGSLNVGLLGLTAINLLLRRWRTDSVGGLPLLLSLVGNVGLFVSAWYGGHLVYEYGMRVKETSSDGTAEIKPPRDEQLKQGLSAIEPKIDSAMDTETTSE